MIRRAVTIAGLAGLAALLAPPSFLGQAARTSWGEPDISGYFANLTVVPLERPLELGEQEFYARGSSREGSGADGAS